MSQPHQNSFRTETHGKQTLHVRENSDSALEDLFSVVQNPNPHKQSDWSGRNLPRSFFNPPPGPQPNQGVGAHPNHSRNGSQDSTHFVQNLVPNHHRSRSAPVQLAPSLSLPQQAPQHAKQQSVDLVEDMQAIQLSQQSNWGNNANSHSQTYNFVGPANQQSPQQQQQQQWTSNSPSKSHSATALNQQSPGALSPNHSLSPAPSLQSVIAPLPPGWEMSVTADGEIYYINHIDKTTSWFHPHLGNKSQQGPTKLAQLHPQHQLAIQQHIHQQQAATLAQQTQQQMQQQQQPANQQQPTLSQPQTQMASPNGALIGQRAPNGGVMTSPSAGSNNTDAYIRSELLKLQKQKETLRRQQEEIAKKEHLLTRTFCPNNNSATPLTSSGTTNSLGIIEENPPISSQSNSSQESQLAMMKDGSIGPSQPTNPAMQSVTTSGVDPFLGHNTADSHARQNSADSGLGGMGQSYSLPRTPEDFLSNVDEMDSTDGGHKVAKAQGSDFNMNEMEGMGMDVAGMSGSIDAHSTPMDEHELMPSLQDDISSELLEGMEGQKIDNLLTWL